jgi:hypothetical protein
MEPKQNIIPCNHFELLNDFLSREIKNGCGGRVIEGWVGSALVFMVIIFTQKWGAIDTYGILL